MKNILILLLISVCSSVFSQEKAVDTLAVMFYNVVNLFYPETDSLKADDEFTPEGQKHWSFYRYYQKCNNISRVIVSANGLNKPAIVGLCEVEDDKALDGLYKTAGLRNAGYNYIHFDSPDKRGIDVAMFYDTLLIQIFDAKPINVSNPQNEFYTRDILYVKLKQLVMDDTLHLMVCHWPSRLGGAASEANRVNVANCTKNICDSILAVEKDAKIIIMGDFNDNASSPALADVLMSLNGGKSLINLAGKTRYYSYKYQARWETIDHIIVSASLCNRSMPTFDVVRLPFLLIPDNRYTGKKPFRTYLGPRYIGGYSDHLPVI